MAKTIYHSYLKDTEGSTLKKVLVSQPERPADLMMSKNQQSTFISRKPKSTKRRSIYAILKRDRFKQLECMWAFLTERQRQLFVEYNRELNKSDGRNLRPYDRFRSLGLKYQLDGYIKEKLKPDYTLSKHSETYDTITFKVTLRTRVIGEFETIFQRFMRG